MSLLNEMLKDLNQHQTRSLASPHAVTHPKHSVLKEFSRYIPWLVATFVLSLCAALIAHGFSLKQSKPATQMAMQIVKNLPADYRPATLESPIQLAYLQPKTPTELHNILPMALTNPIPSYISPIRMHKQNAVELDTEINHNTDAFDDSQPIIDTSEPLVNNNAFKKTQAALTSQEWHDEELNNALQAIESGDDQRAIDLLEALLERFPASISARESLVAIYLSQDRLVEAKDNLNSGLTLQPTSLVLSTMKARLLFEEDDAASALKILERFNPDIHAEPDFYGLRAAVLQALGRMNEAGSLYKTLVEIEPSNGQYWLGYGLALEEQHAKQQAIVAYRNATESYDIEPAVRAYAENSLKTLQG